MSAECLASSGVFTFSPRLSSVDAIPCVSREAAALRTSSISMPATKREDMRRPREELSAKWRIGWFRDKAIKAERNIGMSCMRRTRHFRTFKLVDRLPIENSVCDPRSKTQDAGSTSTRKTKIFEHRIVVRCNQKRAIYSRAAKRQAVPLHLI